MLREGPPVALVAVQHRGSRPSLEHPGEAPTEIEAVGHGRVHPGAAARRDPVGGVTREEDVALPEAVRDQSGEREGADPLDPDRQACGTGSGADEGGEAVLGVVREALVGRVPREPDHPAVAARRQHHADGIACGRHVQAEAVGPHDVPQRGAELDVDPVVQLIVAAHRDPEGRPHRAVRAVRSHDVARPHGRPVGEMEPRAGWCHVDVGHRDAGAHRRSRQRDEVVEQHRLQVVLGHAGRRRGTDHLALASSGIADVDGRAAVGRGQGLALEHQDVDVVASRADGGLEAPGPHVLHVAKAHDGRARQRGAIGAAVEHQALDTLPGEGDRRHEAGGADPDDGHGDVGGGMVGSGHRMKLPLDSL